jgi:EAL domain-containing protein (putative c-di-GMP-specific phosphodiesterase class I)
MNEKRQMVWTGSFEAVSDEDEGDMGPWVRDIAKCELSVVFQPIIDLRTGQTFAHEALVRCNIKEFISPPVLFEYAVRENATGRLGRMIRELTFSRAVGPVFINVHPNELTSRWLVRPDDPLCFHGNGVYLEITESATFTHYELVMGILREVCSRTGALLAIDDFGAGYSNLIRIAELEPRIVKLDRDLISGLDTNPRKQQIVRHLVNLCDELGADIVAEGVERCEELKAVKDTGARYAQGFFIGRPALTPQPVEQGCLDIQGRR